MKKLLLFFLTLLAFVGCNNDSALDVEVGGDVCTTVEVAVDGDITRAEGFDLDALLGEDYVLRYTLQIFEGDKASLQDVKYSDELTIAFSVKLPPTRDYRFVVWADIVAKPTEDAPLPESPYYNTSDLQCVSITSWDNSERRDAFTGYVDVENYSSSSTIKLPLVRPFAKLRVVDTDGVANTAVAMMSVTYDYFYDCFDAKSGKPTAFSASKTRVFNINVDAAAAENVILTDYLFATSTSTEVNVELKLRDANNIPTGQSISHGIDVRRNQLFTFQGKDIL